MPPWDKAWAPSPLTLVLPLEDFHSCTQVSSTEEACGMLASIPVCAPDPLCMGNEHQTAVGTLLPRCAAPEVVP